MPTKKEVAGEWSGAALTGGCPKGGNVNWRNNPQYALIPSKSARFEVTIAQEPGSSMLPIGLIVLYGEDGQPLGHPMRGDMIVKDGKSKFKASAVQKVTLTLEARHYIIMPSTFEPGMEGAYTLEVVSDDDAAFVLEPHNGPEALLLASEKGDTEVVKLLLDKGASVDEKDQDGDTALMLAIQEGHTEVVKLLLATRARRSTRRTKTATPR
eukprot:scaffold86016_cov63-Phaeocystis_antarctica.AAC.3